MTFDFEGRNFDTPTVESAISWREQALVSFFGHLLLVLIVVFGPRISFVQRMVEQRAARLAAIQAAQEEAQIALLQPMDENETFVFVAPLVETAPDATPRPDAVGSDRDRVAQSPVLTPDSTRALPVAEGNTDRFVQSANPTDGDDVLAPLELESPPEEAPFQEAEEADALAPEPVEAIEEAGPLSGDDEAEPAPEPSDDPGRLPPATDAPGAERRADSSLSTPGTGRGTDARRLPDLRADGLLGRAMRDFRPSVRRYSFGNPSGNVGKHGDLQFDSKGVEFGPWVRRFQAQVYRNWFLPYRVLTDSGHVVLTFNVHRDGSLTDVRVVKPDIDPFNHSASNALLMSNPTRPLPVEFPDEILPITAIFYFGEAVPDGRR